MNKILIAAVIAIIVLIAGFYLLNISPPVTGNVLSGGKGTGDSVSVKTFVVTGSHLRFFIEGIESPDIRVNQGDKVVIEFASTEGFHDWKVDEFNAGTEKVNPGKTTSVEFTADKKGVFEYYCSVGQHRENGMKGNLIVE